MIQPLPKSNKEEKSINRQVNLAATTEYMHWSEKPIEFNSDDHTITVPWPRNVPQYSKPKLGHMTLIEYLWMQEVE
jgi:hypothetical protein